MKDYLTKLCMFLSWPRCFQAERTSLGSDRRAYRHSAALAALPEVRSSAEAPPDRRR